jgi:hypothetical protein
MTLNEWFAAGIYTDFMLIGGEVYVLPLGFKLSKNPQEKKNSVIMANGHKREDIIRRWTKFSFAYDTLLEDSLQVIKDIVEHAPGAEKRLYLRKQNPADSKDYEQYEIDVVNTIKTSYAYRGHIFVNSSINLEME